MHNREEGAALMNERIKGLWKYGSTWIALSAKINI